MSEFNLPRNETSDDADNEADFQTVHELLRQLNLSNAQKASIDLTQHSSIQVLLAYDNDRYDQPIEDLTQQEGELPPGLQNPKEEQLTPTDNPVGPAADLELLAQMICDRISLHLHPEMERRAYHHNRIFSHQIIQIGSVSLANSEQAPDVLERLTQEIEQLLHHRLVYERERQGRTVGRLPW